MVNQAFSDFGPPRFAGTSYHLIKAAAPGAFHPKITMLLGESKARLMVGSANLTALGLRSEEHTSELQSLMRISYAVFCLKKKKPKNQQKKSIMNKSTYDIDIR